MAGLSDAVPEAGSTYPLAPRKAASLHLVTRSSSLGAWEASVLLDGWCLKNDNRTRFSVNNRDVVSKTFPESSLEASKTFLPPAFLLPASRKPKKR